MKIDNVTKRTVLSIFWIIVGAVLFVLGNTMMIDSFWSGFGVGFVAVGILQLLRNIRYRTNTDYKEKVDVEVNDERNKYLSNKAWAWTGYIFVLCAAAGAVVFNVMDKKELCYLCSFAVSLLCVIYFVSYSILRRKY